MFWYYTHIIPAWSFCWDLQLAVYISDSVPEMLIGDPGRFRQIITNLMGNSIKASNAFFYIANRNNRIIGWRGIVHKNFI